MRAVYGRLLRNRQLAKLLGAEFVAAMADWIYLIAVLIVVEERSGSPLLLGIVGAARIAPYALLSVPGGLLADRFDRRLLLLATDSTRCAAMVACAALVATGGPLLLIVGASLVAACCSAVVGPTVGSFLPSLVTDESELGPANSAWASLDNIAFMVGPAIGGVVIGLSGLTLTYGVTAALFAAVVLAIWTLPRPAEGAMTSAGAPDGAKAPDGPEASGRTESEAPGHTQVDAPASSGRPHVGTPPAGEKGTGPRARHRRPLAALIVLECVLSLLVGATGVLTVVIATDVLHGTGATAGFLNAASGFGGLIGALVAGGLILRRRLAPPLIAGAIAVTAGTAFLAAATTEPLALVSIAVATGGALLIEVVMYTAVQRIVPRQMLGRGIGTLLTAWAVAYAAGSFAGPLLASELGVARTLAVGTVIFAASVVLALALLGRSADRAATEVTDPGAGIAGLPIFAGLPPARLESALAQLRSVPVSAGQVIIRQGDQPDRFYIIDSGRFVVTQTVDPGAPPRELRVMGALEAFGEIGLLHGVPRTASVTAATDGRLLALDGHEFLALVGYGPGLSSRLIDLYRGVTALGR